MYLLAVKQDVMGHHGGQFCAAGYRRRQALCRDGATRDCIVRINHQVTSTDRQDEANNYWQHDRISNTSVLAANRQSNPVVSSPLNQCFTVLKVKLCSGEGQRSEFPVILSRNTNGQKTKDKIYVSSIIYQTYRKVRCTKKRYYM